MLEFELLSLGFKPKEIDTIENHFSFRMNEEDWHSLSIFEDVVSLFNYFFVNDNKLDIEILLEELNDLTANNLKNFESALEYLVTTDTVIKLPTGRWVVYSDNLNHKNLLAEID